MTNGCTDRLDRVERILETMAQRQEAISQQQEINTRSIELLGQRVDSNAKAIASNAQANAANTQSINAVAEAAGRTLRAVEALRERAEEDRTNFQEYRDRNDSTIAELRANLAILQQLLRDRNGNGNPPQA